MKKAQALTLLSVGINIILGAMAITWNSPNFEKIQNFLAG